MSPSPQLLAVTFRLTKNRLSPRTGVGQKSSAAELTGAPRFWGAPKGASVLLRWATQISSPPSPPGRFEARYRLSPSGDWIGQPSRAGVFRSGLLPAISSTFWAGAQPEKCVAPAAVAIDPTTATIATATASLIHLRLCEPPFLTRSPPVHCSAVRGVISVYVELQERERHSWACDSACDERMCDVGLSIHLLGSPRMDRAGAAVDAPRGHKAWGLLAYLLRSRVP